LVTSTIHPQEDKPDKRVYTITTEGRDNLQSWLSEPQPEQSQQKHTFLLKLFFAAQTDKETVLTQLRLQRNVCQRLFELHQTKTRSTIQDAIKQNPQLKKDAIFWEATRRFGELYQEMYINWLNETINAVEEQL